MANIRVDINGELIDGMTVTFKAPCDCSEIQGIRIYYNKNGSQLYKNFTMKDSRVQNLSNVNNLFAAGAYVTVVLDTVNNRAFLQNAATSGYLEEKVTPVDNLESDRSDLPLSARMGSELNKNIPNKENLIGFPNYTRVLDNTTLKARGKTYTATERCWIIGLLERTNSEGSAIVYLNDLEIANTYVQNAKSSTSIMIPLKKGDVFRTRSDAGTYNLSVYAML